MAAAPTYITHKELKRIFPQLDEFDQKTQIFGWQTESISGDTYYVSYDSGLMTQLFIDGKSQQSGNQTIGTTKVDDAAEAIDASETIIDISDYTQFTADTFIKIDDEIMYVEAANDASPDTLTVVRGVLGTTATTHDNGADIFLHFQPVSAVANLYDADNDFVILKYGSDPNDLLVEVGEDFADMVTQYRADASRYFDSRVDPSLPKNQLKDKAGNYDYMVVRTVGLIAACFMMRTKDHNSEVATSFMEEAERNIELLNEGKAALSWQNTADAPQGTIRDVSYTDGSVRPVDTRGEYSGTFDLIRVLIVNGGAMDGTATYSVWVKDGDKLGNQQGNQVVTAEKINGDFQALAGGLQIRFGGDTKTSVATATNEWEVEVTGRGEYVDSSDMKAIKLTRSGTPARRYYK